METYYHPQDLPKFEEIGEEAPELARKFLPIGWFWGFIRKSALRSPFKPSILVHETVCDL